MGCASSKGMDAAVYRPAPTSFAVFDITTIEEPWLKNTAADGDNHRLSNLPPPILEKIKTIEDAPGRSWDEVSKALQDLNATAAAAPESNPKPSQDSPAAGPKALTKNFSYHTLEELEAKVSPEPAKRPEPLNRSVSMGARPVKPSHGVEVPRSLKENIFIVRDRQEREGTGKPASFVKRDPLEDFEERCPPGGATSVVVYTTSLGGVRRTFEDCNRVRQLMEGRGVAFDERDVALDAGFRGELRELLGGDGAALTLPRVFVKGRYIGGVEEVVGLNETGRLSRILNWAKVERGPGRLGCRGCGGARFVPCLGCGGSCKVVVGDAKERCGECNENGLAQCPLCA